MFISQVQKEIETVEAVTPKSAQAKEITEEASTSKVQIYEPVDGTHVIQIPNYNLSHISLLKSWFLTELFLFSLRLKMDRPPLIELLEK